MIRRLSVLVVALIATLCAYHYWTHDFGCGATAEGRLLLNAMATYRYQHQGFPPTLSELQPILRNNTPMATTVNHLVGDTYEVRIALSPKRITRLRVEYRIDEAGQLEKYHVEPLSP